eukprot:evm.model.NODE_37832_length_6792_cov_19.648262.1
MAAALAPNTATVTIPEKQEQEDQVVEKPKALKRGSQREEEGEEGREEGHEILIRI